MGLLSSGVAFTCFKIVGGATPEILRNIPEALIKNAFRDIDGTTDERSFGWVSFDNFLDTQWASAPPEKGEFLSFALRLDTRRISPAVFRKYFHLAMEKETREQQAQGRKFISKERKKELREQVKIQLLSRTLPVPAVFDVAWNTGENTVYFCSIRDKIIEMFVQYFAKSFDLQLEKLTPYTRAQELLPPVFAGQLDAIEPTDFGQ